MLKLILRYLFLVIMALIASQTPLIGYNVAYSDIITFSQGGFKYNVYHNPVNIQEIQGMEISDIVIKSNGYTEPTYFIPFLFSKKGQPFDIYNIQRDEYRIMYLTNCSVRCEIATNGTSLILYYYIEEAALQGILSLGLSSSSITGKVSSNNYNRTGSKYSIGTSAGYSGNTSINTGVTLIGKDAKKFSVGYSVSDAEHSFSFGLSNFDWSINTEQINNLEDGSYDTRLAITRDWYSGANHIIATENWGNSNIVSSITYSFEPTFLIPYWMHISKYKVSSDNTIHLSNRGYSSSLSRPTSMMFKVIEEFYIPLRVDRILLYGGFLEYTSHDNQGYLSAGTGFKFNFYSMGKCLNISFVFPLTNDPLANYGMQLSGSMEDIF